MSRIAGPDREGDMHRFSATAEHFFLLGVDRLDTIIYRNGAVKNGKIPLQHGRWSAATGFGASPDQQHGD